MWDEGIDVLVLLAERKIAEAMEQGAFDRLALKGQPIALSRDPWQPPERRLAHTILKNAGVAPPELSLRRELMDVRREFARAKDPEQKARLAREIRELILHINVLMKSAPTSRWIP